MLLLFNAHVVKVGIILCDKFVSFYVIPAV